MAYVCCILVGYLVGTFNPSYLLAQIHGFDIREKGSGNAGASNALILFGKVRGVICALLDIAKATAVIHIMVHLFPNTLYAFSVTAVSCILGHMFPFYMKFRGGKGLACLGGTVLAFDWRVFVVMLLLAVILALVTRYICFVPITASVAFPIVYGVLRGDLVGACILAVMSVVIPLKHIENLRRIRNGTEARISALWNRDKEIERISRK